MSDLIRREDAYAAIRGLTRHIDRIAAIRALPAVQPHVNETPKREHEDADVLTPDREAALREALAVVIDELRSGPCALEARRFLQSAVGVEILALLDKPAVQRDPVPNSRRSPMEHEYDLGGEV